METQDDLEIFVALLDLYGLFFIVCVVVLFCGHKAECSMRNTENADCSYKLSIEFSIFRYSCSCCDFYLFHMLIVRHYNDLQHFQINSHVDDLCFWHGLLQLKLR